MKMNRESLSEKNAWDAAGVILPDYDVETVMAETREHPVWIHFGAGNIFRGFLAAVQQRLLNEGAQTGGIIAAEVFDCEIIDRIYRPYDNLALKVTLNADGTVEKEIIGSIAEAWKGNCREKEEFSRLKDVFCSPSLQLASFTVTEKGYALTQLDGCLLPNVKEDMERGPSKTVSMPGVITALLYERYLHGRFPLAVVSMDNCSENGKKLKEAVLFVARAWVERKLADKEFLDDLADESRISFPWTMIDKITPHPSMEVKRILEKDGIEGMESTVTEKHTFIAPFVNAERPQLLVVEDSFPNGRPPFEQAGIYMTDRETVKKTEMMKVMTCLNPLHTALAVFGCILGYQSIAAEMKDEQLKVLVEKIGYEEGLPVVTNPGILEPEEFLRQVLEERLPNPYIPDTPQRIASDTSQKIGIRFGGTIRAYMEKEGYCAESLQYIPLVLAGWLRYLTGLDDQGGRMELSPDTMAEPLKKQLMCSRIEEAQNTDLKEVLSRSDIFGADIYQAGLGEKTERYFREMVSGPGAVRNTLKKYCGKNEF
ncbi:mannitol dehydrogenase family protein [Clostridium sp. AM58-1XD]|uniref:mannitol dehydrogenase family protein n=1 Tax=Clostridium sp. AM58-1XD TaxID=2292307 RepID=UPI000E4E94EE|nr:mannitol dehydrogenase family protein [Clostridium sp. AM58-1XD]RGZ00378.1 mannitol dehydrogenase family protein [Clostridium sp. AM58-1XD]